MALHDEIANLLGETNLVSCEQIERVIARCGEPFTRQIAQETLALERGGGLLTKDGSRRRTASGVFFTLVRGETSPEEYFFIQHGRPRSEIERTLTMSWPDRLGAADEARRESGEISAVSIMIVGIPKRIVPKENYVLVTIEQEDIPPLPKGLPMPPLVTATFLVGIAQSQWRKIAQFVRDGEPVIVTGYPMPDEKNERVVVYATKADTPSRKKFHMQQKKGQRVR